MSISQILAILRARWLIAISVLALTLAVTAVYNLVAPKKYTSSASIMVDVKSPDPVAGMVLPAMMTPSYMATLVDLLVSERVALRVVRSLRLGENPQLMKQWRAATEGKGDYESWVAGTISKGLDVRPSRESNIIAISYIGADPTYSAALCNAFVDAYISTSAELRMEPAKQYNSLFETLNNQLRERLEKAQTRLSTYQRENGLVTTDERYDTEMGRMGELSNLVTQLQTAVTESQSRKTQLSQNPEKTYEVLGNNLVASLKGDLSRMEAKLEEAQSRYGDNHPSMVETRANISALRQRIAQETSRVSGSVSSNGTALQQRLDEARQRLDEQRTKVLRMKALRDEASVMMRDVDNIQRAYDVVQARATQSRMESQATQTNLSVLKSATVASSESSPRVTFNFLVALMAGTLLGLVATTLVELFDRRVRAVDDITTDLKLPLMGVMLKSADARSALLGKRIQPWLMRQNATEALPNASVNA
jgi:polysaccharide biosynthesis transport protein